MDWRNRPRVLGELSARAAFTHSLFLNVRTQKASMVEEIPGTLAHKPINLKQKNCTNSWNWASTHRSVSSSIPRWQVATAPAAGGQVTPKPKWVEGTPSWQRGQGQVTSAIAGALRLTQPRPCSLGSMQLQMISEFDSCAWVGPGRAGNPELINPHRQIHHRAN